MDMNEAMAAGERMRKIESYYFIGVHPERSAYTPYERPFKFDVEEDRRTMSLAFLYYFDETPLTVEALVREGFVKHGCYYCHKQIRATAYKDGSFDFVNSENNGMFYPSPRTVGDLRRLLYQLQRDGGK